VPELAHGERVDLSIKFIYFLFGFFPTTVMAGAFVLPQPL
jgi:hypothetical protein